jgi:hypothetical protein
MMAIHDGRLAARARGHGLCEHKLEEKFRRTRAGAKTLLLRKERAAHIALENKLLVER